MRIALDDIVMSTNVVDVVDGATWLATGLDGWDSPETNTSDLDFALKDGAAPIRSKFLARPLTLAGVCKTTGGEDGFWTAYNRLTGILGSLNTLVDLTVDEGTTRKTLLVRQAGKIRKDIKPGHFEFEVPLTAPNPIKYGSSQVVTVASGLDVTITNTGNYPSDGILTTALVDGSVRVRHVGSGRLITTSLRSVDAGTVFDHRERTVKSGTINRYSQLGVSNVWWSLEPGANVIRNLSDGPVTIQYRPAWI